MKTKTKCKHEWRMKKKMDGWNYDEDYYCIHCLAEAKITNYEREFKINESHEKKEAKMTWKKKKKNRY